MTALKKYHDKLIVELSGEEISIVKDALDRARKESDLRDRKSLLLFIVKSFLDGTVTSGRESRKPYTATGDNTCAKAFAATFARKSIQIS